MNVAIINTPEQEYENFSLECNKVALAPYTKSPAVVITGKKVRAGALEIGLRNDAMIYRVFGNKIVEGVEFIRQTTMDNGHNQGAVIYGYRFKYGYCASCYLAFFKARSGAYVIKSIHLDNENTNYALLQDLKMIELKEKLKKEK